MVEEENVQRKREFFRNAAKGAFVGTLPFFGSAVYLLGIEYLSITSYLTSDSIQTQKELEAVVEEERTNLGMSEDIELLIRSEPLPYDILGCSWKIRENTYGIIIDNTLGMKRAVIQHELYHVYDGHCDRIMTGHELSDRILFKFLYTFWDEPQAVLYQSVGLKL